METSGPQAKLSQPPTPICAERGSRARQRARCFSDSRDDDKCGRTCSHQELLLAVVSLSSGQQARRAHDTYIHLSSHQHHSSPPAPCALRPGTTNRLRPCLQPSTRLAAGLRCVKKQKSVKAPCAPRQAARHYCCHPDATDARGWSQLRASLLSSITKRPAHGSSLGTSNPPCPTVVTIHALCTEK